MLSKRLWWLLSGVNALALLFIIQINVGLVPTFPAPPGYLVPAGVDKFNSLVSDLSQGVIISTLFFILLVYLPTKKRSEEFFADTRFHVGAALSFIDLLLKQISFRETGNINRADDSVLMNSKRTSNSNIISLSIISINSDFWGKRCGERDFFNEVREIIKSHCEYVLKHPDANNDLSGMHMLVHKLTVSGVLNTPYDSELKGIPEDEALEYAWRLHIRDLIDIEKELIKYNNTFMRLT